MIESIVPKDWQEENSYDENLQHSKKKKRKKPVKPDVKICI